MGHKFLTALLSTTLVFGCLRNCFGEEKGAPAAEAQHVVAVAAAADLKFALDTLIADFQKKNPAIAVKATYGSSGNFFTQLLNKAPFDLFLSADIEYPQKLIDAGLAVKGSKFSYAIGRLVVWVPKDSKIDVKKLGIEALLDGNIKKIAIANPKHAPYGRAAEAALKKLGVYEKVSTKLALGENIAQTAQFVESGAADIGLLALSLVLAPAMKDKGVYWEVPQDAFPKLEQGGVMLSWAKDVGAAKTFQAYIVSAEGKKVLKDFGFLLPAE